MAHTLAGNELMTASTPSVEGKKIFPFMKLIGELRNRVYYYYFEDSAEKTCTIEPATQNGPRTILCGGAIRTYLPLIHSSRETRQEAGSIFFKTFLASRHNVIMVRTGPELLEQLRDICAVVKPWKQDLSLEICFSNAWSHEHLTPAFFDAIVAHMAAQLDEPEREPIVPDFEKWKSGRRSLQRDAEFRIKMEFDGGFSVVYACDDWADVEECSAIVGPLAEIDWAGFEFTFPERVKNYWDLELEAEMEEMEKAEAEADLEDNDDRRASVPEMEIIGDDYPFVSRDSEDEEDLSSADDDVEEDDEDDEDSDNEDFEESDADGDLGEEGELEGFE